MLFSRTFLFPRFLSPFSFPGGKLSTAESVLRTCFPGYIVSAFTGKHGERSLFEAGFYRSALIYLVKKLLF